MSGLRFKSVERVGRSTESLASAAEETSESMEEMASAMLQVDTSAAATAALSGQVVEAAEMGQLKVRNAINCARKLANLKFLKVWELSFEQRGWANPMKSWSGI